MKCDINFRIPNISENAPYIDELFRDHFTKHDLNDNIDNIVQYNYKLNVSSQNIQVDKIRLIKNIEQIDVRVKEEELDEALDFYGELFMLLIKIKMEKNQLSMKQQVEIC
jgi:hypothetical protein